MSRKGRKVRGIDVGRLCIDGRVGGLAENSEWIGYLPFWEDDITGQHDHGQWGAFD